MGGFQKRFGLAMAGKNPWGGGKSGGSSGSGSDSDSGGGDTGGGNAGSGDTGGGPRNPWLPGGGKGSDGTPPRRSASIEDIFKNRGPEGPRRGAPGGGSGGGTGFRMPERPGGKSWFPLAIGAIAIVFLGMTMAHQIGPKEKGVVTTFGAYSRTLDPGLKFTFPWPFQSVNVVPVSTIRSERIPDNGQQKLILTGDQNLVDLSYIIRWNIKDLKQFQFQLASPEDTIREVAEAAMRASVAEKTLDDTFSGAGRAEIEARVRTRMQAILDAYRSGVAVQGVEIDKTDPPAEVNEAFKDVSVAEQDANAAINTARGTAQQILQTAQGETGAFDRVYEEYRRAPEVTRRRLYYETMERVLSQTDKTIVETDGVQTYLPLPEIQKRTQAGRNAAAAATPAPATTEGSR
ncbi:Protein HflK [Alteripontixanthobacter maritimus]|uniref:Protein HflK n=2 Tax=Alteripontixanthobacter maritimus TaxID=2161824 RepID=A0A369Q3L7_9SPHN|nr:Protein HflK [Alteripontixanthobacter maritimus]